MKMRTVVLLLALSLSACAQTYQVRVGWLPNQEEDMSHYQVTRVEVGDSVTFFTYGDDIENYTTPQFTVPHQPEEIVFMEERGASHRWLQYGVSAVDSNGLRSGLAVSNLFFLADTIKPDVPLDLRVTFDVD